MKKDTKKRAKFKGKNVKYSFTGNMLTRYAGLSPIMKFINKLNIGEYLDELFPTIMYNSSKFSNVQVLLSVVLASLSGVNRLVRMANFTSDALVMRLLGLQKGLNKDVIGVRLKELGQAGAIKLQEYLFGQTTTWLKDSELSAITLDGDSTVNTVYGNQEGAAKGFNSHKKGAKSYHPILAFVSEMKLVVNSWFRTGSAYTSNGICEFIKQTAAILPSAITSIFFRADSGFFNGVLFDLLESFGWSYLVKVKLKNLKKLLANQSWQILPNHPDVAVCEFDYQGHGWKKSRKLRALRTIKEWQEVSYFEQTQLVPVYEYACYCSNLEGDAVYLHQIYKQRSTSETWIEQIKSQLLAGKTLTDNFHANDILWQLTVLAYNLSVMMRCKLRRFWREEHATFREWFINIPAKLIHSGRYLHMKMYENYYYKQQWSELENTILFENA